MRDKISERHSAGEAGVVFGGVCLSLSVSVYVSVSPRKKMRNY